MRLDQIVVGLTGLAVVALSWWIGLGSELGPSLVIIGFLFLLALAAGSRLATTVDPWLRLLLPLAFLAKIAASFARWGMVEFLYGFGDSTGYHSAGILHSVAWAAGEIPEIVGRSMGTRFVENVTALLYVPFQPHPFGGFIYFAAIAFVGQVLFYLAYRRSFGPRYLRHYAVFVFFMPALVFWPSSIGKDALMVAFLGAAFLGSARLLEDFKLHNVVLIGLGLWGAAVIRSHIALIAAGSLVAVALFMKPRSPGLKPSVRRVVFLTIAVIGGVAVATLFADTFGLGERGDGLFSIDLTIEDLDPVVADIERRTGQGGSGVEASAVRTLREFPIGFARVLFSPFPWQAHNAQATLASVEGIIMAGVLIWALPAIVSSFSSLRRNPYLMLSLVYTLGFSVAFSAILNLGIMTRQRSQVTALFLALCFGAKTLAVERREQAELEKLRNELAQLTTQRREP